MEKYEAEHVGDRILLDGLTPCEHVEYIMEEYRTKKELEKMRKVTFDVILSFEC